MGVQPIMNKPPVRLSRYLGSSRLVAGDERFLIVTYDEQADEEIVCSAVIVVDELGTTTIETGDPQPVWRMVSPNEDWVPAEIGYWLAKMGVHVSASMTTSDMVKIAGALTGELEIKAEIRGMLGETRQDLIAAWAEDRAMRRAHEELDEGG